MQIKTLVLEFVWYFCFFSAQERPDNDNQGVQRMYRQLKSPTLTQPLNICFDLISFSLTAMIIDQDSFTSFYYQDNLDVYFYFYFLSLFRHE